MALIKCEECGKEFSDRASACPNCACPLELKENKSDIVELEEKEIVSIILDKNKMRIPMVVFIILGIIFFGFSILFLMISDFDALIDGLIAPVVFFGIMGIMCFFRAYLYKKSDRNQLVLTNKRLRGQINFIFSTSFINIPLERVDHVIVTKDIYSTGISIMSNKVGRNIYYVMNAEEFVDMTIKEIEKYKNR